jgi:hypothetical protein
VVRVEIDDVADSIGAQVLDELEQASWVELQSLCVDAQEWWVMGRDACPYVIRAWAHTDLAGIVVRVRVDNHGWTRTEPTLCARLVASYWKR